MKTSTVAAAHSTSDRLASVVPKNILAISVAEGGAMGCPGEIILAEKLKDRLEFLYFYDNRDLEKIFPWFREVDGWTFGPLINIGRGWRHIDIGAGNHLFLRRAVYDTIGRFLKTLTPVEVYTRWKEDVTRYYLDTNCPS